MGYLKVEFLADLRFGFKIKRINWTIRKKGITIVLMKIFRFQLKKSTIKEMKRKAERWKSKPNLQKVHFYNFNY